MHTVCASVSCAVARALNRPAPSFAIAPVAAALAALALTPPAFAAAAEEGALEEVIVTAQFRQENLQDTALAITAVSGELLEQQGLTNLTDLGLVIPNANIRPQGSFSGPTPFIGMRGVQTSDYIFTSEPGVGVYIDDVYQGTLTGSAIDLLDLERVEVLRGPQGTLFGKNSLGGAIRLISKQPTGNDTGTLEVTYGTSNRLDLRGVYDFKLTENLFARITGVSKQIDGYQDVLDFACQMRANGTPQLAGTFPTFVPSEKQAKGDCKIAERGGSESNAARLMLRYLASDKLEMSLAADYSKTNQEPAVDSKLTRHQPNPGFNLTYDNTVVFPKYGIRFTDDRFLTGDPFKTYAYPGRSDRRQGVPGQLDHGSVECREPPPVPVYGHAEPHPHRGLSHLRQRLDGRRRSDADRSQSHLRAAKSQAEEPGGASFRCGHRLRSSTGRPARTATRITRIWAVT